MSETLIRRNPLVISGAIMVKGPRGLGFRVAVIRPESSSYGT